MASYDQISVIFKIINKEVYQWVCKRSEEEDMSKSAFIVRSLKKIRKMEKLSDDEDKID